MLINVLAYPLLTLVNVVRFMIQGMGFSMFAILAGVMEMIARSLAGMFLVPALGFVGRGDGQPAGMGCGGYFPRAGVFPLPPRIDEPGTSPACDDEGKRRLRLP